MNATEDERGRPSKVARLIDEYDLGGIGADLETRWTADDPDERSSLRDLAHYFNRRMLREILADAATQPLDGEVENVYRLLVDEEVSPADRTRVERHLERDGIDVDEVRSEFVSYQAIRRYLRNHRDAEYSPDDARTVERIEESIQRLRSRTTSVTESKVEQLRRADAVTLGEKFRASVDVRITCEECGSQFAVQELLNRGGCNCP